MRQLVSLWGVFVFGLIRTCLSNEFEYLNQTEVLFGSSYEVSDVASSPHMVPITLIPGAVAKGAVCLDGSPPAYHWDRGFGSGANNWLVNLEGGGWCNHRKACTFHKTNQRGSSNHMEKQIPFGGILSNKQEENPDFFNWNRVKIKYCDGASFAGDSEDKAAQLQFRGQRIFQAAMEELMSQGMRQAKQALLSGCSAGGLATILHCDQFRNLFPCSTRVKCFADAGLFLDAVDVAGGHTLRKYFGGVVGLQEVKSNLPITCTNHLDVTSCFFPENLLGNITAPLFLLNAAYDSWQVVTSLMPHSADPKGIWQDCKNNYAKCSASQIEFLQGFRNHMLNAVKGWSLSKQNGLFINSCFAHCQSERQDTWFAIDSPVIGNKDVFDFEANCQNSLLVFAFNSVTSASYPNSDSFMIRIMRNTSTQLIRNGIAVAVGDWYFDRAGSKAVDCAYPCDKSCHNLVFKKSAESFSL